MKFTLKLLVSMGLVLGATTVSAQQTLKMGHYFSTSDFRGKTAQKFADSVHEKGNEIKVSIYPNESLVKGRDALQATSRGTVDLYSVFVGYITGSVGLMKVFTFPFPSSAYTDQKLMEFANHPEVIAIMDKTLAKNNIKLLGFINSTGNTTGFFRKPLNKLDDFKGLKIRGVGGYSDLALEELGSSIVFMSAAEQFLQLETGGVDAVVTTESSYINQDLASVAPYTLKDTVVRGPYALIINKKKWDRLSDSAKNQLKAAVTETIKWSNANVNEENKKLADELRQRAKGSYSITNEEKQKVAKIQAKVIEKFIAEYGKDAETLVKLYQQYQ